MAELSFRQKSQIAVHLPADHGGVKKLKRFIRESQHCLGATLWIDITIGDRHGNAHFLSVCNQTPPASWHGAEVTSFILTTDTWSMTSDMGAFIDKLVAHFAPNLESLELNFTKGNHSPPFNFLRDGITFPLLRRLKYDNPSEVHTVKSQGLKSFYSGLLRTDAVPNLEVLEVTKQHYFFKWCANVRNLLPKLHTLEIGEDVGDKELDAIAKSGWTLTSLNLAIGKLDDKEVLGVLFKMKFSLEHVTLRNVKEIVIPPCPKLRTLLISFDRKVDVDEDELVDPPKLYFAKANVSKMSQTGYFPALKMLTIKIGEGYEKLNARQDWVGHVFPEESNTVLRSLRILKVPSNWVVEEQDIRNRMGHNLQILYLTDTTE